MKKGLNRRDFIKTSAGLGAAVMGTGMLSGLKKSGSELSAARFASQLVAVRGEDAFKNTIRAVEAIGGIEQFVKTGDRVVILPNPQGRIPSTSTNDSVVRAVVKMCKEAGAKEVICTGKHPLENFERNNLKDAVEKEGGTIFPLTYPSRQNNKYERDQYVGVKIPNGQRIRFIEVDRNVVENDVFITIPICKQHAGCNFTGTMKNFMGVNLQNSYFHVHNYADNWDHLNHCIVDLNLNLKINLCVVDGMSILLTNGPFGPGETTDPQKVVVSTDRVAADSYCAQKLVGLKLEDVPTIVRAGKDGLGETDLNKVDIEEIEL